MFGSIEANSHLHIFQTLFNSHLFLVEILRNINKKFFTMGTHLLNNGFNLLNGKNKTYCSITRRCVIGRVLFEQDLVDQHHVMSELFREAKQ